MSIRLARGLAPFVLGLSVLGAAVPAARAEAPQQKTQVPGYYRQMVGAFEVTALYDGQIMLDAKLLKNASATDIQKLLARQFRLAQGEAQTPAPAPAAAGTASMAGPASAAGGKP